ncbi:MAG: acetyl-CoA carboxylase, carboxyltransferase subunit beta [Sulfuricurvum sp.]|nr:acetyl-CoA carboxylase, carboxyltransferase subunit beta [Sulfuricurvum sp.]MDP3023720.1 acetyl-CoA carboxylase, carboxyltransferase subunit beta [Sulfuricurvum sp.]MDP3119052.1 acetyl-CoA carboxylase, carboxyltransferase subunit beta [Sulfuricurvum sp.]
MSLFNLFGDSEKKKQPTKSEAPSHWVKCTSCQSLMYYKEMEKQNHVCPKCGFHLRIGVKERLAIIADEGSFVEFDASLKPIDPLAFVDKKSYAARIQEGYEKNGRYSSVVSGECTINSVPVQLVVFDFNFMGGSLGSVEGEKIVRAINRAIEKRQGVIIVSASGGARMQESTFSLMQMSKTSAALARLAQAKLPYISLLTDPTMGGVSASFATLGDIIIAEPGALVGFAGQRVIKQTIGSDLPDGFQRAEFLLEKGSIDMIVERNELKDTLSDLLTLLLP